MQTRFMRSKSMVRGEKRGLDNSNSDGTGEEDPQPDRKRPALASVIVEALKMDNLQKLCSSLEPILRRVVSEEVERALAKLGPTKLNGRSSPKKIGGPDGRNLQLQFRSKLSLPLFTGGKVEGENGSSIHIVLIDANTGHVISFGPQSSAKLDVVVLEGDFNIDDEAGWTEEEFESHIVKEREGKRPLLNGELQVTLKEGVGTLGELTFTDNSSWIRSRKFRLGLKGASGCFEGLRIREAKTDSFSVKDHRGELYKKHYPPALTDEVWRLEKIGKDGSFHKRLSKAGIHTVEDFLRLIDRDSQRLRTIMGSGMSNKMWEILVEHAKTCVLSGKLYVYYPDELRNVGVVFNNIYELSGLISNGQYHAADSLSDHQKVYVDTLVKKAYDNWMNVVEYDGKSLLSFTQNKSSSLSSSMAAPELGSSQDQSNSSFDYQHKLPILPPSISTSPQSINTGNNTLGEFSESYGNRFPLQSQSMNQDTSIHVNDGFAPPHNALINTSSTQVHHHHHPNHSNLLALGSSSSSQSSMSTFQACDNTSSSVFRGYDDVFSEEEIRVRSHEMLENDDMQHLLRFINMGSYHHHGSENDSHENSYQYTSSSSSPYASTNSIRVNGDRRRSSGKAVVGWLKLKAALRWGIFIRKKAAEKRAQLVELD